MTPETPTERRLREMGDERQSYPDDVRALDAGREALALLRVIMAAVDDDDVCRSEHCQCECSAAVKSARQLLARCGGQEGTE